MLKAMVAGCVLGLVMWIFAGSVQAGPRVDWGKINPALKGAASSSSISVCLDCHEDYIKSFAKTKHARHFKIKMGKSLGESCESCHGPMSAHLAESDFSKKAATTVSFKSISAQQRNQICQQCHEKGLTLHWKGSAHEMSNVSCNNCHYIGKRRSKRNFSIYEDSKKACFQCHKDKRARMLRSAHMPLREGKMSCASCHNPHGSLAPSLLIKASVNETCYVCHQEKRGPMLWEHAPVREDCSNCHDVHGSNHLSMLKWKPPYLCQTCHSNTFHPSELYDKNRAFGSAKRDVLGKACLNCHSRIHGSNHPSGVRFQR
ncbi:MAG: DmsE family decaheme c-type cytochrome [Nitrospinaceae bacterium]|nr:DmsE family decaheme c-type cytochrome [Nitrospinaceae bacterium]NIR57023.1 DmsE family decaheme c-type cytochrome [Nitrospinaceae bacterium]NIS87476.1 DmsE family decaheme c-type cytochrome [Nitrospinaceae bacterium]NIT84330.1 DmsE family decaheme c-type cytochrome [Nitrospinaceae bacterium]NIU46519.1 DmsE family decaheme c-type cytochrome [Nitrospinaceae bacterium]